MEYGHPEEKKDRVLKDGEDDAKIRSDHHVLYTANAKQEGNGITWEVAYCAETPSAKVCTGCDHEHTCRLSESTRRF